MNQTAQRGAEDAQLLKESGVHKLVITDRDGNCLAYVLAWDSFGYDAETDTWSAARALMPLDVDTVLESVEKTRRAIVAHDVTSFCGPGAEIAARISESLFGELASPVARLGAPYAPLPFADELNVFPTTEEIISAVKERIGK
ncbi:MAG: transketolase C-terminal domain-containing protein [Mycobacterium sp.]|uniref:transketolase C-terminal domain-containing protein n=1 Tax=Mycobacterium sp. TaxID=1785 RepID=UPI003F9C3F7D